MELDRRAFGRGAARQRSALVHISLAGLPSSDAIWPGRADRKTDRKIGNESVSVYACSYEGAMAMNSATPIESSIGADLVYLFGKLAYPAA
jgi:hypothetical protein